MFFYNLLSVQSQTAPSINNKKNKQNYDSRAM